MRVWKLHAWMTVALLVPAALFVVWLSWGPMLYGLSGKLLTWSFPRYNSVGYAVGSIHTAYMAFTFLLCVTTPYLAIVWWLSRRRQRLVYWSMVIATSVIAAGLLAWLTCATVGLAKYIAAFGWTSMRVYGCVFSIAAYGLVALCLWLIVRPRLAPHE